MLQYPAYVTKELNFVSTIKNGDTGMKAKRVQEWLSIHGFPTPVDSDFGDATETCVRAFQQAKGIDSNGKVQEKTWNALVEPLTKALSPFEPAAGLSMASAVLRTARQHLAQSPIEIGGDNCGPWVRLYVGGNEGAPWRWCAGFVTFIMKQACQILDRAAPLPGSYSCDSLAYQAGENDLFVKGTDVANGNIQWSTLGSAQIFLVRSSATDWTHTGFCFAGTDQTFSTIEGNTNDDGSANGYEVCKRTRAVSGKDLIRFPN